MWTGVTLASKADEFADYIKRTGVPGLLDTTGNQRVFVFRRIAGDRAHFVMISLWESMAAIKGFAGDDVEKARYYPEDEQFLLWLEPTVNHFDVLVDEKPGRGEELHKQ